MRVMVTGATTLLGAAIIDHLLASRDVDLVLAVGRQRYAPHRRGDRIEYHAADLTHPRGVHDLVWGPARDLAIEAIVHVMQHRASDAGGRVHAQNVTAVRDLLVACEQHPTIRRFVYRSFSDVYAESSDLIDEDAALDFAPGAPQWLRDRVEADLAVCAHLGGRQEIAVLRCADIVAPCIGSRVWEYLTAPVCLRPLGFDPMLHVLSLDDAAAAFGAALASPEIGVFNIPGCDTLPLSRVLAAAHRIAIPWPASLLPRRFRLHGGILDGTRARVAFGYAPRAPVSWEAHHMQEMPA